MSKHERQHKNFQEKDTEKSTKPSFVRKGLAIAAIPTAILAAGIYGHNKSSDANMPQERPAAVKIAAEQVAQRFECELDLVENRESAEIPAGMDDGQPRMEVRVGVNLTPDPIAAEALQEYATDATVQWYPPALRVLLKDSEGNVIVTAGGNETDARFQTEETKPHLEENPDGSARLEQSVFPKKTYEPGTEMDLFVTQQVMTSDDLGVYDTYGIRPCTQKAVWNGKTWELTSSNQSISWPIDGARIEERFTPWQK